MWVRGQHFGWKSASITTPHNALYYFINLILLMSVYMLIIFMVTTQMHCGKWYFLILFNNYYHYYFFLGHIVIYGYYDKSSFRVSPNLKIVSTSQIICQILYLIIIHSVLLFTAEINCDINGHFLLCIIFVCMLIASLGTLFMYSLTLNPLRTTGYLT